MTPPCVPLMGGGVKRRGGEVQLHSLMLFDELKEILELVAGDPDSAMELAVDPWLAVPVLAASFALNPFFDSSRGESLSSSMGESDESSRAAAEAPARGDSGSADPAASDV